MVCLINPPDPDEKVYKDIEYCYSSYNVPHLGLGYIYSVLKNEKINVDIYECMAEKIDLISLYGTIKEKKYTVIGITCYDSNTFSVIKIADWLKQTNPSSFIFIGGCHATIMYESLLETFDSIDCCVIGEGEITCLQLIKAIQDGGDYKQIEGIAYKKNGGIIKTGLRPLIEDLDTIPFPYRKFISVKGMVTMTTSRGCYGRCIFCPIKVQYNDYGTKINIRFRSAKNVVDEIYSIVSQLGAKYINFDDDNFLCGLDDNRKRIKQIIESVKEKKLDFKFSITARANDILTSKDIITELKNIGLEYIFIGIESFSQRQLDFFNKKTTIQQNIEAIRYLSLLNIKIDMGFLYLEPYTTIDEILDNLQRLSELEIYRYMYIACRLISMYSPLIMVYRSPFYEYMKNSGLIFNNKHGYKFFNPDVDLYYNICKQWQKYVFPLYLKYYLIFEAKEKEKFDLANRLENERINLAKIDIFFLIELCKRIIQKNIRFENYKDFILEWSSKLQQITDLVIAAEKELS